MNKKSFLLLALCLFGASCGLFTEACIARDVHSIFNKKYKHALCKPKTVAELKEIILQAERDNKKIAVLGAGKSTGGQTFAPDSLQIDTSSLNKIISIDLKHKTITLQPGVTWGAVQKMIDPIGLSVAAMQSYCDFSVGGSIGVNVHGQDHVFGGVGATVLSLNVLLADGSIMTCSRTENAGLFSCVVGGYGLFGIITEATLQLTDNCVLTRRSEHRSTEDLFERCQDLINDPQVQLFSSRLSVDPDYIHDTALTIVYEKLSDKDPEPITEESSAFSAVAKKFFRLLRTTSWIKKIRFYFGTLYVERTGTESSRNNVMHSSIEVLNWSNPASRDILQEYFVPVANAKKFLEMSRDIIKKYKINLMNNTVRYVHAHESSFLSYARENSFSFVMYCHINNNQHSYERVQKWTHELIDAVLECGGTFYLPYQNLATDEQLHAAYPMWNDFVALKKQYDPQERFVNELYLRYA